MLYGQTMQFYSTLDTHSWLFWVSAILLTPIILVIGLWVLASLAEFIVGISIILIPLCFFYHALIIPVAVAWALFIAAVFYNAHQGMYDDY